MKMRRGGLRRSACGWRCFLVMNNRVIHLLSNSARCFLLRQVFVGLTSMLLCIRNVIHRKAYS